MKALTIPDKINTKFSKLTDKQLLNLCQQYGENARLWRQKFAGLLPEVNRRHLYLKKGFSSIYQFAYILAGMTKKQVQRVLQIEQKLENTPELKRLLIEGEVSSYKLAQVAYIATPENEEYLVEKVRKLPKETIEVLVSDMRRDEERVRDFSMDGSEIQSGLFEPQIEGESVPGDTFCTKGNGAGGGENGGGENGGGENGGGENASGGENGGGENASGGANACDNVGKINAAGIRLTVGIHKKIMELQEKGIDINEMLDEMLKTREVGIMQDKEELSGEVRADEAGKRAEGKEVRKYVGAKTKRLIEKEHGNKCSAPGCKKKAKDLHHTARFGVTHSNDPLFLAPLCKGHHDLAHDVDERYRRKKRGN